MTSSLLLKALACEEVERPPVWLMRQAGRYLPEYQALRLKHTLSTLFHTPRLAAEVTMMPLRRFSLDAAIIFSDLVIPAEVLGKEVIYPQEGGLKILPLLSPKEVLSCPSKQEIEEKLFYVFETIRLVLPELDVPLLGFCGAPFSFLYYLLGGDESEVRRWMTEHKESLLLCLDVVCEMMITYAKCQLEAGVQAVQIFDSWAHLLSKEEREVFSLPYLRKMEQALGQYPLLLFTRFASQDPASLYAGCSTRGARGISFDEGMPLSILRDLVPSSIAVQGNLSPRLLCEKSALEVQEEAFKMASSVRGRRGVIFNLGHGILPKTPVENVYAFLQGLREG